MALRRVVRPSIADRRPLEPERAYTLAANELLATGGRFPTLRDDAGGRRRVGTDSTRSAPTWSAGPCSAELSASARAAASA